MLGTDRILGRWLGLLSLGVLSLACIAQGAEERKALETAACRAKALDAEKAQDWAAALDAWERVIDRCMSTEEQRTDARAHIRTGPANSEVASVLSRRQPCN